MAAKLANRRKANRQNCVLEARAYVDGCQPVRCTLRDITPQGARLTADEPIPAAGKLLVFLPSISELWAARVRWRRGRTLGVEFMRGVVDLATAEQVCEPDLLAKHVTEAVETDRLPEA